MAVTVHIGNEGWKILDASAGALPKPFVDGPGIPGGGGRFQPSSWSRDGSAIVGFQVQPDGRMGDVYVYRLADGSFTSLGGPRPSFWRSPLWLSDGRRLLVRDERAIWLVDVAAKAWTSLYEVGGYPLAMSLSIAPDDRWLTHTETATEGDVWIAELGEER